MVWEMAFLRTLKWLVQDSPEEAKRDADWHAQRQKDETNARLDARFATKDWKDELEVKKNYRSPTPPRYPIGTKTSKRDAIDPARRESRVEEMRLNARPSVSRESTSRASSLRDLDSRAPSSRRSSAPSTSQRRRSSMRSRNGYSDAERSSSTRSNPSRYSAERSNSGWRSRSGTTSARDGDYYRYERYYRESGPSYDHDRERKN